MLIVALINLYKNFLGNITGIFGIKYILKTQIINEFFVLVVNILKLCIIYHQVLKGFWRNIHKHLFCTKMQHVEKSLYEQD